MTFITIICSIASDLQDNSRIIKTSGHDWAGRGIQVSSLSNMRLLVLQTQKIQRWLFYLGDIFTPKQSKQNSHLFTLWVYAKWGPEKSFWRKKLNCYWLLQHTKQPEWSLWENAEKLSSSKFNFKNTLPYEGFMF